jgi:hypothetical protein
MSRPPQDRLFAIVQKAVALDRLDCDGHGCLGWSVQE